MVQTTSFLAYQEIKPKLNKRQDEVYTLLLRIGYPRTNYEIAKALGRPINAITPRTLELREKGYIEFKEYKYILERKAMAFGVKDKEESQRKLF